MSPQPNAAVAETQPATRMTKAGCWGPARHKKAPVLCDVMSLVCDSRRALTSSAGCSTCTPAFWGVVMRRAWTGLLRRPFQSRTWSRSGEVRRGSAPGHICGCQPGMLCPGSGHRDGIAVHQSQPQLTLPSSGLGPGQPRVLFVHSHKMPGMTRTVGFKMQLP